MAQEVTVSNVENNEKLKPYIEELLRKGMYEEISRAIGMHSILNDPQHALSDQARLYRFVLDLIKKKISAASPKNSASWLSSFPRQLMSLVESGQIVADRAAADILAARHAAFGPFKSVDEFYFWALDDRRLPLALIVKYIEKTVERQRRKA